MTPNEPKNPSVDEPKRKKKKRKAHPVIENVESLVMAVVLALIIRTFIVEAFVIPTGSMAETLRGQHLSVNCPNCGLEYPVGLNGTASGIAGLVCPNCGTAPTVIPHEVFGGDRILVNKALYRLYPPTRWDPFVFINPKIDPTEYPPKTTYIKRLVGMPDETFEIIQGDVVVNGEICRKPPHVQDVLWMPVYNSRYVWKQGIPWRLDPGWTFDGMDLSVDAPDPVQPTWATYAGKRGEQDTMIRDDYGYDVMQGRGHYKVTDVRVRCDVTVERSGTLMLKLPMDVNAADVALIDFDAKTAQFSHEGVRKGDVVRFTMPDEGPVSIAFYRVDYRLGLAINGEDVLEYDLWSRDVYLGLLELMRNMGYMPGHDKSGCDIGAMKGKFTVTDVRIDRDIYYTPYASAESHYFRRDIPKDRYFALGDNSPDSRDSRDWGFVPAKNLLGKALTIWWPIKRIGLIR